ncbi:MAG: hypothetical protein WA975_18080 [Mesorhizobium sp.]
MIAAINRRNGYDYERDIAPIVEGKVPLPNAEAVDPLQFLNNLAAGGHSMTPQWGLSVRYDGSRDAGRKQWTQFFLRPIAMGGQGTFDGSGYAVIYGGQRYDQEAKTSVQTPIVLRFAVCKHEFKGTGSAEAASRGWRPGYCAKCGLDMSVDSSG